MAKTYLPTHASIDETCNWLREQSGESWTLARLMEYRVRPYFWLDYSPDAPPIIFGGRVEGYLAEIIFNGDINRLQIDGTDVQVTMTKTHDGTLFKSRPPFRFPLTELRFKRDDIEKTLARISSNDANSTDKLSMERTSSELGNHIWKTKAQEIALQFIAKHKASDLFPSQDDIADKVAEEMRERKIYGAHGTPLSSAYIKRNAISGEWWKANKP